MCCYWYTKTIDYLRYNNVFFFHYTAHIMIMIHGPLILCFSWLNMIDILVVSVVAQLFYPCRLKSPSGHKISSLSLSLAQLTYRYRLRSIIKANKFKLDVQLPSN
jgi:hypothetical protein